MAIQRPDTPLAATPDPITNGIQSVMTSKANQKDGKYSTLNKQKVTTDSSDGSSSTQFTKQTDKENGKSKFKQYNVITNADGSSTMQINVKTNTGKDRTRIITNPDKIKNKLARVLRRNEM
tara:strand:- start:2025 stop:2387 length:363 start_codon:yes stop_codon:yes gene_type:complete